MTALAYTVNLDYPTPLHLEGDKYLVTGTVTGDTGDYAADGTAFVPSQFGLDTYESLIFDHSSLATIHVFFNLGASYALGKLKLFVEDSIEGIEAEHGDTAATAQTIGFIAVGRKAR
jgi:hypothetical protein